MRKSNKKDRLQPTLTHKIESKLLISSKQTSTLSSNILSKIDHIRNEEELQREYNIKFMTDRKKNMSNQKSQKSLSSSKVTNKDHRQSKTFLIPQKLNFQAEDFRKKYYELHDEYIEQRRKNVVRSQKTLNIKQSLCNFLSCPDSRGVEELSRELDNDKIRDLLRRTVEQRRKAEAGELILKEAMRILQVQNWDDIIHNLRARVERFRNLDECTFKILELQSINKRVVNDFEEKLRKIRIEQEQSWQKERQRLEQEIQDLKRIKECSELESEGFRRQLENVVLDIKQLINSDNSPRLVSNRTEIVELYRVICSLKNKLQDIEVEAEDNMYKLLKSNEEMVKFERNIEHIRGEMEQQIIELQQQNEQNLCQINHLQLQLEEAQQQIKYQQEQAKKVEAERLKTKREKDDERILLASTLGIEETHPAKLLLKIKDKLETIQYLTEECSVLKAALNDKDELNHDLKAQIAKLTQTSHQLQQTSKTSLYEKEEYKFLLNNLRDQVAEMKKQHLQEKMRIVKQKDEEIVISHRDILQSHAALNDQLTDMRSQHARMRMQFEETKTNLDFFKKKAEQQDRLIIQKQGVIKKLISQGDRYKNQLREIQGSFREVVEMEEMTSKKALTLENEKGEHLKMLKICQQFNVDLQKTNNELNHQKNQLKTELNRAFNDLKELKDIRVKLQASNVELRLEGLNKQSQISKLEEKLKNSEYEAKTLKSSNDKLMSEINSVTRKLISAKNELKRKFISKIKDLMQLIKSIREQSEALKLFAKSQISSGLAAIQSTLHSEIEHVRNYQSICNVYQKNRIETVQNQSQCQILSSDLRENVMHKLTSILTTVSLLRNQKREIEEEMQTLEHFGLEEAFQCIFEDVNAAKLRNLQGSIEMIKEESRQEQESSIYDLRNTAKIIGPEEIFGCRSEGGEEVNNVLQVLLEDSEIPSLPYWQKIQANFLTIRRKLAKKSNLKLDISAIDYRDPSLNSPQSSCYHENDLVRRIGTEPDDIFECRESNRSERFVNNDSLKKEHEELKARYEELMYRLGQEQQELQSLRGKLVKLQNQTSIVGLEYNFKKIIEYLLADNFDLFLQTCRVVMKMLHFNDLEIKDFQGKAHAKKKKNKGGFLDFFKK